jgi:hypothetical protein
LTPILTIRPIIPTPNPEIRLLVYCIFAINLCYKNVNLVSSAHTDVTVSSLLLG